jgi:TolB-like protein/Tfp pilus assembly protein PilF/predicted Ser/Thr protein kinase
LSTLPGQDSDDITRTYTQLAPDTIFGHYRIIDKIGAGGMGEVYLAEDTKLDRKVAIKFLPQHLCQNADCRARFTREAQATAKLSHPNIVTIHEVSDFNGRPFFAMEHVEGQTLKDVIAGKPLPMDRIIEIGIQVCEGLQAAHEKGITHRDIKPSNILLDSHGRARIVDFGLASVLGTDQLTKTGSTLGTIGYMSPEQVRGGKVDDRTDLFSFGVVLYEMITGHSPFKADSEAATLHAITNTKPDLLARYRREVPAEIQAIIDKALEKDVATRYQHADDIATDLKRLTSPSTIQNAPRRDKWNRYVVISTVVVLLLVAGYWGVTKFTSKVASGSVSGRKMLAVLPFQNLGSPDDEYFADGITDEITEKLASIHGLGVISHTSTILYKHSTKTLRKIAEDLGVDYILEGTTLWDKGNDSSRVRILARLIRVSDDTHLWAETYQRPLMDIFSTQADIANKIAEAMNVTLLASDSAALREPPTKNLDAYQAYLSGLDYFGRPDNQKANYLLGVQMLQKAVGLDSTFAIAYAQMANIYAWMYWSIEHDPSYLSQSKSAVDRALRLQPNLPTAHVVLGRYYYWGFYDYDRALEQFTIAGASRPNNASVLSNEAYIWRRQGKFRAAVDQLKQALALDPRNFGLCFEIAGTLRTLRNYAAAEEFQNRSISLRSDQIDTYQSKARNYYLWRGDTRSARAALDSCPRQDNDDMRAEWYFLHLYERDYSAALSAIVQMSPMLETPTTHRTPRVQLAAVVYALMHDSSNAQILFDSARVISESELRTRPNDYDVLSCLGIIYAGLGRKDDAIREGKLAVQLLPVSKDAYSGPDLVRNLAEIYVMLGEYDAAFDQIEYLLSIPSRFSVPLLRLEPWYDPLRTLPRYQKILEKYGT